jgi:hypothetical protein
VASSTTTKSSFAPSTFSRKAATIYASCRCQCMANLERLLARRQGIAGGIGPDLFRAACWMGFEGAGLEAPQPALSEWPVEALGEGQNRKHPPMQRVRTASSCLGLNHSSARMEFIRSVRLNFSDRISAMGTPHATSRSFFPRQYNVSSPSAIRSGQTLTSADILHRHHEDETGPLSRGEEDL